MSLYSLNPQMTVVGTAMEHGMSLCRIVQFEPYIKYVSATVERRTRKRLSRGFDHILKHVDMGLVRTVRSRKTRFVQSEPAKYSLYSLLLMV